MSSSKEVRGGPSLRNRIGFYGGPILAVLVLFLDLKPGEPEVTRMASLVVLMATWWITEALPVPVTALLPLVLLPLLGIQSADLAARHYFKSMTALFLGGFLLALAIERRKPRGKAAEDDAELPLPTPRILAFADADIASDLFIQNRANQMALLDGIAWLAGDVAPAAVPKEDEDLRIQHLKGDELLWFYLPVFAMPLMVLIAGFVIVRRAGGGLRRSSHV